MKYYYYLLIVIIARIISSCNNNTDKNLMSELSVDTIIWDDFDIRDGKTFFPEELVKTRRYVKLDSTPTFIFGGGDKIITRNNIYVLDMRQKKIIIFDDQGAGLLVLHRVGQGPQEYLQITDFDVDDNGNIYIVDGASDKLIVYDQNGSFVSATKFSFEADLIHRLGNGNFLFGLSAWNKDVQTRGNRFAIVGEDMQIHSSFVAFDDYQDNMYWISSYRFIKASNKICYNKPIDDYVYIMSNMGLLVQAFYFDFGDARIPFDWRKDVESNIDRIKEKYRCLKNHVVVTDKYIIGTLWDRTETKPFLVDLGQKKTYIGGTVAESDVSDFLDFTDNSVVSLLSTGKDDMFDLLDVPKDVQAHVAQENFALMVTELL
ncbi:6-bladed beta-propeller [Sphingobacterium pedocola]|nr:6-bladed beta-propeller [Sphingobacterium pedocola]